MVESMTVYHYAGCCHPLYPINRQRDVFYWGKSPNVSVKFKQPCSAPIPNIVLLQRGGAPLKEPTVICREQRPSAKNVTFGRPWDKMRMHLVASVGRGIRKTLRLPLLTGAADLALARG